MRISNKLSFIQAVVNRASKLAEKPTLAIGITKQDIFYSMNNDL